jgi:hypothetical protein
MEAAQFRPVVGGSLSAWLGFWWAGTMFLRVVGAWMVQTMTPLQIYLLVAPFVLLAVAGLVVWLIRPRDRIHPGE